MSTYLGRPKIIRIVKEIVFRDRNRTVLRTYVVGMETPFTYKDEQRGYFITPWGGIFVEEAEELSWEELQERGWRDCTVCKECFQKETPEQLDCVSCLKNADRGTDEPLRRRLRNLIADAEDAGTNRYVLIDTLKAIMGEE